MEMHLLLVQKLVVHHDDEILVLKIHLAPIRYHHLQERNSFFIIFMENIF